MIANLRIQELFEYFHNEEYVRLLERALEYARREYATKTPASERDEMLSLLLAAWESAVQHVAGRCQDAHKRYLKLRRTEDAFRPEVDRALRKKVELSELSCSVQKGLLVTQSWSRRNR